MKCTLQKGKRIFHQRLAQLEERVGRVAIYKCLSEDERQELYSAVMEKVIDKDYAVLRGFRGESSWSTFLTVVVQRVLLDLRTKKWGRWRPCAAARRLGPEGVELDRRMHRDGLEREEAVQIMLAGNRNLDPEALRRTAELLPRRTVRRLMLSDQLLDEHIGNEPADQRVRLAERRARSSWLATALCARLEDLSAEDRRLLELRFARGWTISKIAREGGLEVRGLYRHFARLLRHLRRELEDQGWDCQEVRSCLGHPEAGVEPGLWARSACSSPTPGSGAR